MVRSFRPALLLHWTTKATSANSGGSRLATTQRAAASGVDTMSMPAGNCTLSKSSMCSRRGMSTIVPPSSPCSRTSRRFPSRPVILVVSLLTCCAFRFLAERTPRITNFRGSDCRRHSKPCQCRIPETGMAPNRKLVPASYSSLSISPSGLMKYRLYARQSGSTCATSRLSGAHVELSCTTHDCCVLSELSLLPSPTPFRPSAAATAGATLSITILLVLLVALLATACRRCRSPDSAGAACRRGPCPGG